MPRLSRDMWIIVAMLVIAIVAASLFGGSKRADRGSELSFGSSTYSSNQFGMKVCTTPSTSSAMV